MSCVVLHVGSELGFRVGHNLSDVGIVGQFYMSQNSKSWYYTCTKWMGWHQVGPMTLTDVLVEAYTSHYTCDVFIQDLEEEAMEVIKVGEKYHWTNSKEAPNMVQEVEVLWVGESSIPYSYDGPVVLIGIPNREYYKRYVLVPARVLRPKPGPCSATMKVAGMYIEFNCIRLEGHVEKHKTTINIVTPGQPAQLVEVNWQ